MIVRLNHWSLFGAALIVFLCCNSQSFGQDTGLKDTGLKDTGLKDTGLKDTGLKDTGLLNRGRPAVNLGGWSDEVVFRNWKVQRHAIIGHSRLLDANGHRVTFGTYETCLAAFKNATKELEPLPKRVVIVMHGLGATPWIMNGISKYIADNGKLHVENIGYASTLEDIAAYAKSLDHVMRNFDGVERIDFVAHSMGNIVIRRYLADREKQIYGPRSPIAFGRFVMISPPNHGAELADTVADLTADSDLMSTAVKLLAGEPAKQLATRGGWRELEKTLITPDFEFAIIVGGRGDNQGYLKQLPGDDDALLTIETSKLVGAADYIQIKGLHQLMPTYEEVQKKTLSFLQHGYFIAADQRQPIK